MYSYMQEEDEPDTRTMVRARGPESRTIREACGMSEGTNTSMGDYNDTLESRLGTMVINAESEEDEGTMKSKWFIFNYIKYNPVMK